MKTFNFCMHFSKFLNQRGNAMCARSMSRPFSHRIHTCDSYSLKRPYLLRNERVPAILSHFVKHDVHSNIVGCSSFHSSAYNSMQDSIIRAKVRGIQKDISPLTTKKIVRRKKSKDAIPKDQELFDVVAYAVSEEINLESLVKDLCEQGLYDQLDMPKDLTDAIYVEAKYRVDDEPREIIFFREGSIIFWNMPKVERSAVMQFTRRHQQDSYDMSLVIEEHEEVEYSYTDSSTKLEAGEFYLEKGGRTQSEKQIVEKYAFSNALSLSVKLAIWEASLQKYVDSIEYVLDDLKEGNKLRISRAGVLKKSGELLNLRHLINLSSDLLDTPDFYWDRDELEQLYNKTCSHFNINRRVKIMNEKLSSCFELTELLRAHLAENHSSFLEWLIIILIGIEICFEVVHLVERYWWDTDDFVPIIDVKELQSKDHSD